MKRSDKNPFRVIHEGHVIKLVPKIVSINAPQPAA